MATIFPPSPSVDDEYQGYKWDGTTWNLIGNQYNPASYSASAPSNPKPGDIWIESDVDVPSISPETILTTTAAASTYQPLVSGVSNTEIGYLDGVTSAIQTQLNAKANLSGATFTGDISTTKLTATSPGGDEGGEINLAKAATNTTLDTGVAIDVNQNKLRIFEQGGNNRGAFLDISTLANGVASPISTIDSGSTVKTFSTKSNLTQVIYGSANYNFYNATYTTNSKTSCKLLITFGVAYECNLAGDFIQLAVSLNGTDEFTFTDTAAAAQYNEMPFYTFISTNSYSPSTTISNLRVYIKTISANVVVPRNAGTLHNFFLTVQEIAV